VISLVQIETEIDAIYPMANPPAAARSYLALAEQTLILWLQSKDVEPTEVKKEGFRLLALHRQGAKGDPGFNACRETCRELAYRYNVVTGSDRADIQQEAAASMTHLARHLALFIGGKMQIAGLGDFCCASKPIRTNEQEMF
jgi:hypothetical protein